MHVAKKKLCREQNNKRRVGKHACMEDACLDMCCKMQKKLREKMRGKKNRIYALKRERTSSECSSALPCMFCLGKGRGGEVESSFTNVRLTGTGDLISVFGGGICENEVEAISDKDMKDLSLAFGAV